MKGCLRWVTSWISRLASGFPGSKGRPPLAAPQGGCPGREVESGNRGAGLVARQAPGLENRLDVLLEIGGAARVRGGIAACCRPGPKQGRRNQDSHHHAGDNSRSPCRIGDSHECPGQLRSIDKPPKHNINPPSAARPGSKAVCCFRFRDRGWRETGWHLAGCMAYSQRFRG